MPTTPETEVFSSRGKQPVHGKSTSQKGSSQDKMGYACLEGMVMVLFFFMFFHFFFELGANQDSANASDHAGDLHRPCRIAAFANSVWMGFYRYIDIDTD